MEGTLEAVGILKSTPKGILFQSISSWKVLWKAFSSMTWGLNPTVSIHLFMEGTLEAEFRALCYWNRFQRFNPSLHGRYSGRIIVAHVNTEQGWFQSISSWKVLWKWPHCCAPPRPAKVSIHLFMEGTLEGRPSCTCLPVSMGFNPSLHGRYSGRHTLSN